MTTQAEQRIDNSHIIEIDLASFVAISIATSNPDSVELYINKNDGNFLAFLDYGQKSNPRFATITGTDREKPSPESVFSRLEDEINKIKLIKGSYHKTSKLRDDNGMTYAAWEKKITYK